VHLTIFLVGYRTFLCTIGYMHPRDAHFIHSPILLDTSPFDEFNLIAQLKLYFGIWNNNQESIASCLNAFTAAVLLPYGHFECPQARVGAGGGVPGATERYRSCVTNPSIGYKHVGYHCNGRAAGLLRVGYTCGL